MTKGVGAVLFTVKVEADTNVVMFELGSIGLNVIRAAGMIGADKIISTNLNPARKAITRNLA